MKHEITNNFAIDAIKDNYTPPKMTEMREDVVEHLFEKLNLNLQFFKDYIYSHSESYKDNGHIFYNTTDVAKVIKHLLNIEQITN